MKQKKKKEKIKKLLLEIFQHQGMPNLPSSFPSREQPT